MTWIIVVAVWTCIGAVASFIGLRQVRKSEKTNEDNSDNILSYEQLVEEIKQG